MKWVSAVSGTTESALAADEVALEVRDRLQGARADLAVLFVSGEHAEREREICDAVLEGVGPQVLLGCSAGGVIGDGREIEDRPGISLTAGHLPGVHLSTFHLDLPQTPSPGVPSARWRETVGLQSGWDPSAFLLLADPLSYPPEPLLDALDRHFPLARKIGGLASGRQGAPGNSLFLGDRLLEGGVVGVVLSGEVEVETVVAQGCRPIGEPMLVTRAKGALLLELDGTSVVEVLRRLYESLDETDQRLFRHSLFLGVSMRDEQVEYGPGDFLIRNVAGIDPRNEGLVVGTQLREQQVVQFHIRDAAAADQDLEECLARASSLHAGASPEGALLFSCLGRGMHLFGYPDHDTDGFRKHFGAVPLGGFFCNGEIGPVMGRTFLHGYTSSFGLFRTPIARSLPEDI
jgi:small ligand-binding sensory domain FIST